MLLASLGWFWHPLHGAGYQFWSGIGSDVTEITIVFALLAWWHSHHCHVHRCWRVSWWPHPDHGHPVCRHHHPDTGRIFHNPDGEQLKIEQEKPPLTRRP